MWSLFEKVLSTYLSFKNVCFELIYIESGNKQFIHQFIPNPTSFIIS